MSAWLTPEDIEAAKAIGRQHKPLTEAQKQVIRETFGPLIQARNAALRDAASKRPARRRAA